MVFRFPVCIGGQLGSVGAVRSVDVPFPVWVGGGSGAVGVPFFRRVRLAFARPRMYRVRMPGAAPEDEALPLHTGIPQGGGKVFSTPAECGTIQSASAKESAPHGNTQADSRRAL